MNKKFSTLLVSALLAGASCFTASAKLGNTVTFANLKDGQVVYLQTGANYFAINSIDGSTLVEGTTVDAANVNYAYWQWKVSISEVNATKVYKFTNVATGKVLTLGTGANRDSFLWDGATLTAVADGTTTKAAVAFEALPDDIVTATTGLTTFAQNRNITWLNNQNGYQAGFAVDFFTINVNGEHVSLDVEANPFSSVDVKAYPVDGLTAFTGANANAMLLKVAGDWNGGNPAYTDAAAKENLAKFRASQFIVMDKEVYSAFATNVSGSTAGKGYKFTTVYGAQLLDKQAKKLSDTGVGESVTHPLANACFNIAIDPNHASDLQMYVQAPYLADATQPSGFATTPYAGVGGNTNIYVSVFNFEGKVYIGSEPTAQTAQTHIQFTNGSTVSQKEWVGQIVNIEYADAPHAGQAWDAAGNDVLAKYVDTTIPEGQWIVQKGTTGNTFQFINRESTWPMGDYTLYKTSVANVFTAKDASGDVFALKLTVAPARADRFENYANLDEKNFADEVYNIAVSTELFKDVYLAETGLAKTVALTSNEEEAGAWKLTKWTSNKSYEAGIEKSDTLFTIHQIEYWNKNKAGGANWDTYKDTLAMFAYTIQNQAGEYLAYDEVQDAYVMKSAAELKPAATVPFDARRDAPKFIMKEKFGKVNLLDIYDPINHVNFYTFDNSVTLPSIADKMYGAFSYNKVSGLSGIYQTVDNDLFTVEIVAAPEYRRLAEDQEMKNVIIFKDENANDVLFEKGDFLGMEHVADYDMAAAMFVDTAYVRYETRKPQYLLAVRPTQVIDKEECEIEGHPHSQCDTVYGDFLVNLVDTAKAYAAQANKLPNPYIWEGGYKLAFVSGKHTADKLIIDAAKPAAKDTIDLSKNVNKVGTYAFRYVDRASESFIIETSLNGSATPGYIKWLNGTPVVIADATKAEVFNLTATEEEATANEAVEAAEVSVVAVNGAIIVKGAAGKVVTVANILGQTIANQVAASDNVTIAAPAGIAVVTVDGEATKVVVK